MVAEEGYGWLALTSSCNYRQALGTWCQAQTISVETLNYACAYIPILLLRGSAPLGGGYCHNPFPKLSPHSLELSLPHPMCSILIWPGSSGLPNQPQSCPTIHSCPLHRVL